MRNTLALILIAVVGGRAAAAEKLPLQWDGPLYTPMKRDTVHEFAREPSIEKVGADKRLYIADDANLRIIRLKLGYHAEKRLEVGGR